MTKTTELSGQDARPEIDLVDVLKGRVAAGKPIYLTGQPSEAIVNATMSIAQQAAEEAGMPAQVVQIVELPELKPAD
jgi:hypothetical protein